MKIVRLTTTNNKCVWDNYFNENLIIKKNSKIALQNLSCELDIGQFTINAQNNIIQYNLSTNTLPDQTREITLNDRTYNKTNIGTLFQEMIVKLNSKMGTTGSELGKEWDVGTNKELKFEFQCNAGTYITMNDPSYFTLKNTQIANNFLVRNAGTVNTGDANCFFKTALCLGSAIFRIRLTSQTIATTNSGVLMGLTENIDTDKIMSSQESKYAIKYINSTVPYNYVVNGVEQASLVPVDVNDDVFIVWTNGILIGVVRKKLTATETILFSETYNHTDYLFPFISMYGDANCRLPTANIRLTSSYSYNKLNSLNTEQDDIEFPFPRGIKTTQRITIPDPDLAKFLGFTRLINNSVEQVGVNLLITADKQLNLADNAESYIVELETIPLEFYDGLQNQRKNYLYVFPNNESTILERINYSTNYPVYLDIKSNNDIMLKNIRARLIREDNSTVNVIGLSTLSLLISEEKE